MTCKVLNMQLLLSKVKNSKNQIVCEICFNVKYLNFFIKLKSNINNINLNDIINCQKCNINVHKVYFFGKMNNVIRNVMELMIKLIIGYVILVI